MRRGWVHETLTEVTGEGGGREGGGIPGCTGSLVRLFAAGERLLVPLRDFCRRPAVGLNLGSCHRPPTRRRFGE